MWEKLTYGDIVEAKEATSRRRREMLARHAEEMRGLETEYASVDALDRLIDDFAAKYKRAAPSDTAAMEPEPTEVESEQAAEAAPAELKTPAEATTPDIPAAEASAAAPAEAAAAPPRSSRDRRDQQRPKSGTVFDTFSRALSRNI